MPLYFNISGENDGESDISLIFNDLSLAGMAGAADGASVSFGSRVSSGAGLCVRGDCQLCGFAWLVPGG